MARLLMNEERAKELHRDYGTGLYTHGELAKKYGISRPYASFILKGRRFPHLRPAGMGPQKPPHRRVVGSAHHSNTGLDDAKVLAIREAFAAGETESALAARHKVDSSTISQIVRGYTWKHVGGPIAPVNNYVRGERQPGHLLTREQVEQIFLAFWKSGERVVRIAERYPVSEGDVHHIIRGRKWRSVTKPIQMSLGLGATVDALASRHHPRRKEGA